ncbi:MAG TPA: GNAT family N-acetyltransferase [Thermoanaerobaculia bacterium]|nr:GNAT family N-acetyltransferase [Thermoanaerobaculia bacterium]
MTENVMSMRAEASLSPRIPITELADRLSHRPVVESLPGGFRLASWLRPSLLSAASQDDIFATLVRISTRSFGADMAPYWAGRKAGGYFQKISRFCLIIAADGTVVGWTGFHRQRFGGRHCLYLDSTGVLPEHQGSGIVSRVQSRILARELAAHAFSSLYLITRTENPVVYRMLQRAVGAERIHPSPRRPVVPEVIQRIGADTAVWLGQEDVFDPPRLKVAGAYSNLDALYGELPTSGDGALDAFFQGNLRPVDAFLVIADANFFRVLGFMLSRGLMWPRGGRGR